MLAFLFLLLLLFVANQLSKEKLAFFKSKVILLHL